MMTNEEYLAQHGNVCPNCGSGDITGGSVEIEGRTAWQEVRCLTCGTAWNDLYNLVGYQKVDE